MANTSPDNLYYPVVGDQLTPLATRLANMQSSNQTAFNAHPYRPTDLNAQFALSGMPIGALASVQEGGALFEYNGSVWVQKTQANFASVAARDVAYAKASAAYRIAGATAVDNSTNILYRHNGTSWQAWDSDWVNYTPTISGLTVGTGGSISAQYRFKSGVCLVEGAATLGTSPTINFPRITHPVTVTARNAIGNFPLGLMAYIDIGINTYMGFVVGTSATQADFRTQQTVSPNLVSNGGVNSTVPFTFGPGDIITWRYEVVAA